MGFVKNIIVIILKVVQQRMIMPLLGWCGKEIIDRFEAQLPLEQEYVDGLSTINFIVLSAAMEDWRASQAADPENCQITLNACMEALRHEQLNQPLLMLFAMLAKQGYSPPEIISRVGANMLCLGMCLERRLTK